MAKLISASHLVVWFSPLRQHSVCTLEISAFMATRSRLISGISSRFIILTSMLGLLS